MAKSKEQKQEIIRNLKTKLANAKSVIFASFNRLGVDDNNRLRQQLKDENSEYYVAKKTLLSLALKDQKIDDVDSKKFDGQIATVFSYEDEVAPAKIVDTFRKDLEDDQIEFLGGLMEGKFITADEVNTLAKLPSKQELKAKLVGSLNAPISGFVNVLQGNLRSLVYALKAIGEQK